MMVVLVYEDDMMVVLVYEDDMMVPYWFTKMT